MRRVTAAAWRMGPLLAGTALLVATLAPLASCGGAADDGPPAAPPFLSEDEVLAARAEKDATYRSDEESPIPPEEREGFEGLDYYPYDESWRLLVRLERYDDPIPFTITTTGGAERPAVKVGTIHFERDGQPLELQVYTLRDLPAEAWNSLFLPFMDQTTGKTTYGAGRYVELAKAARDWYVLDFNLSYNPLCAYGRTIYRCPATPPENRLPLAIEAGERGWGAHPRQGPGPDHGASGGGEA